MNVQLQSKLEILRADYHRVTGYSFSHFFCPVLFQDENTSLCKAHIINHAFPNSSRKWTVQRKDVDVFYGSNFEADFFQIQYREAGSVSHAITNKNLNKNLNPKITVDGRLIDYFISQGEIPKQFTPVLFENEDGQSVLLGLKITPEEFVLLQEHKWDVEVSKDIRVSALVSLIKAAHLTLFELIGYSYALSAGGYFVGWEILGMFFSQNHNRSKSEILANALPYFREFANMVRPFQSLNFDLKGTISDGLLFICKDSNELPWAFVVLIKTSLSFHAVLIPILDQANKAERFYNFLHNEVETIQVSLCRFNQDHWEIDKQSNNFIWPKKGVQYPKY